MRLKPGQLVVDRLPGGDERPTDLHVETLEVVERPDAVRRAYPAATDDLIVLGAASPALAHARLDPANPSTPR